MILRGSYFPCSKEVKNVEFIYLVFLDEERYIFLNKFPDNEVPLLVNKTIAIVFSLAVGINIRLI